MSRAPVAATRLTGALVSLVLAAVVLTGSRTPHAGDEPRPTRPITVATGSPLGVYYTYGEELAGLLTRRLAPATVTATDGSVENLKMIEAGTATFGFTTADAAVDGHLGAPPFSGPVRIRAVARLYDNYLHLVVPADSPVRTLAQLRGLRVAVGPDDSGTALLAGRVLAAGGLAPPADLVSLPLSIDDAVTAIWRGHIDAFFWSGGLPTSGITALARDLPLRLIDLGDVAAQLHERYGSTYRLGRIHTGVYPFTRDAVSTVAVPNYLVTSAETPDHLVREVAVVLFAGAPTFRGRVPPAGRLNRRTAIFTTPIPLHPGALAYYRATAG